MVDLHTPGPWRYRHDEESGHYDIEVQDEVLAQVHYVDNELGGRGLADARRIVACVNACEGISTEALEAHELTRLRAEIKALQEALERDATRFEHCAEMISQGFAFSATLCAARAIKALHYAIEARAALKGGA